MQFGLFSDIIKIQAYSHVESSQLLMVDCICLIVHTLYLTLFIVFSCVIAPNDMYYLFDPFIYYQFFA